MSLITSKPEERGEPAMPAPASSSAPTLSAEEQLERLNALGVSLAEKRKLAIEGRQKSGIEDQWREDQEFYEGIDDANRAEKSGDTKPPYQGSPKPEVTTGSTLFPNITAPYCEAAAARMADMLIPTDDRSWEIKPTPVPELDGLAQGKVPRSMLREATKLYPGQPQLAKQKLADATKQALETIEIAKEKAGKAQTRIEDWLVECQFHAEQRKVIEDSARIGSGVLKGPQPVKKKGVGLDEQGMLKITQKIIPGSKRMSAWDLFPDPDCGDNIHNGGFIWERDRQTEKQLQDLKGTPGYIDAQIDACIQEGPQDAVEATNNPDYKPTERNKSSRFELWIFHGMVKRSDLEAAGLSQKLIEGKTDESFPAIVTMVNNRVIKAALNPLDTGSFPYDVMPWRKKAGMPWGDGVARQIRTPQRIVTAALRAMMLNAGRAAGPLIVWQQGKVIPADGGYQITPWKLLWVGDDSDGGDFDVRKSVAVIEFPMYQEQLERIIQIGLKLAEDVTGLPMILQGQQGKAPDTVGGMQLLNDNASSVLRRMARTHDDYITEPHIRRYYVWILQYGEEDEKGDFSIDARGSSALVERSIQNQEMANIVQACLNPAFGKDPRKAMNEYLKSRKLDPKAFDYDDEEWKQIVENMKKGPQDPRIMVAQLKAQLEERLKVLDQQFESQENAKNRQLELVLAQFNEKVEALRLSGNRAINLDDIKAALSETVMQLKQQRDFFVADAAMTVNRERSDRDTQTSERRADRDHDFKKHSTPKPPSEPHGQAPAGKAFQH